MTNEEFTRWQITEMKKRRKKTMLLIGGIGLFFLFIVISGALSDDDPSKEIVQGISQESDNFPTASTLSKAESLKGSLLRELKSDVFTKGFSANYRHDVKALQMELVVFAGWREIIDDAESFGDPEIKKLSKTLKDKVIALQRKEFPMLRKEYVKLAGEVLWEDDIEVKIKGNRYSIIEFVGGMFAANRNIKATQETLTEQLRMFRFKRSEYKWMEYADEYTYYELNPPSDGDLVEL